MMQKMFSFVRWLVLFATLAGPALAQDLVRQRGYLKDAAGVLTLDQARIADFQPMAPFLSLLVTDSVIWVKLTIDLPPAFGPVDLRLSPTTLDDVRLYVQAAGAERPIGPISLVERSAQARTRIDLPAGRSTLFLRVKTAGLMVMSARLSSAADSNLQDRVNDRVQGGLTVFVLTAFAFLIWIWVKNKEYLFLFFGLHLLVLLSQYYLYFELFPGLPALAAETDKNMVRIANLITVATASGTVLAGAIRFRAKPWFLKLAKFFAALFVLLLGAFLVSGVVGIVSYGILFGSAYTFVGQIIWAIYFARQYRNATSALLMLAFAVVCLVIVNQMHDGGLLISFGSLPPIDFFAIRALLIPIFVAWLFMASEQERSVEMAAATEVKNAALVRVDVETQRRKIQAHFMAMLTHELKTPLAIIQLAAATLASKNAADAGASQRLRNIQKSVDDMNYVLERCVEIEEDIDQNLTPQTARLSVKSLLNDVLGSVAGAISVRQDDVGDFIVSDYQFLRIILTNLLTNAVKYAQPNSRIELHAVRNRDPSRAGIGFKVRNQVGESGFPEPAALFSRYYRSEGARKQAGAGLGLWLSQNLALKIGSPIEMRVDGSVIEFSFEAHQAA